CDAADGINNSWVPNTTAPWMLAYAECPSGGDQTRGLVARHAVQGGAPSSGVLAQWIFYAPPGTSIVGMRASYRFQRNDPHWEAALSNGSQVLKGCPSGGATSCSWAVSDDDFAIPPISVI